MTNLNAIRLLLLAGVVTMLAACGSYEYFPDKKVEYQKSQEIGRDLELPPDLMHARTGSELYMPTASSAAGVATYSQFVDKNQGKKQSGMSQSTVMPSPENARIERDGQMRWLVVKGTPDAVWPRVVSFWQEAGILLLEQDPTVGILRTGWLENRASIQSDFLTNAIRSIFDGAYSAATRDQYRVRLEEGEEPGTTEIYLTHYSMREEINTGTTNEGEESVWVHDDPDPNVEAEMLRRLMVYLGIKEQRAVTLLAQDKQAAGKRKNGRSRLVKGDSDARLLIDQGFAKAWRLTGLALDRVGFAVEDRDRSKGLYYVQYNDPEADVKTDEGFFSKLKFWGDDNKKKDLRFQIHVEASDNGAQVSILDVDGNKLVTETAIRILTLIHEQIH